MTIPLEKPKPGGGSAAGPLAPTTAPRSTVARGQGALRVLGFDPGSEETAWALVDFDDRGAPSLLKKGTVASLAHRIAPLLVGDFDVVGVEYIERAFMPSYAAEELLKTSGVQEAILWVATLKGIKAHGISAHEVRWELCRKKDASDAAVAIAVQDLLGPMTGEEHERDAAAVAIVRGWRVLGRRVALSGRAELALIRQIAADKAKRAVKTAKTKAKNKAAKLAAATAGGARP